MMKTLKSLFWSKLKAFIKQMMLNKLMLMWR